MHYIRDKRSPTPKNEITSKTMIAIKGKNTKPELKLRKALSRLGIRGYRRHWEKYLAIQISVLLERRSHYL
jgi:DNA mismatch endonuclease (patch repair protein)